MADVRLNIYLPVPWSCGALVQFIHVSIREEWKCGPQKKALFIRAARVVYLEFAPSRVIDYKSFLKQGEQSSGLTQEGLTRRPIIQAVGEVSGDSSRHTCCRTTSDGRCIKTHSDCQYLQKQERWKLIWFPTPPLLDCYILFKSNTLSRAAEKLVLSIKSLLHYCSTVVPSMTAAVSSHLPADKRTHLSAEREACFLSLLIFRVDHR